MKLDKVVAVQGLSYGNNTWVKKNRNVSKIQGAECGAS
jgi:hypothetical protein